jgi:hypothetical protein
MKTLKKISFLLSFACAMPVVAIDQNEGAKEVVVAKMQEVEQQKADATNAVDDKAEQPSVEVTVNSVRNLAAAGATALYGVVGGLGVMAATLAVTDSTKIALLAGGGIAAVAALPAIYFYKKYKAQFGENFKIVRECAQSDFLIYMLPLEIVGATYAFATIANIGGYGLGAVIGKAAQALGIGFKATMLTAAGTAIAIPSYIEARVQSDKKNPDSAYWTALKFMGTYAKNFVIMSLVGAVTAGALMCAQK